MTRDRVLYWLGFAIALAFVLAVLLVFLGAVVMAATVLARAWAAL